MGEKKGMDIKLEYTLKQITPMIHFQWDEAGVCLRASEVKPKLDKYIIDKLGGKEYIKKDIEEKKKDSNFFCFFVGTPKEEKGKIRLGDNWEWALNYKMSFYSKYEPTISENINIMYFGNMGEDSLRKKTVFFENAINLTIICFIPELREEIEKYIKEFFLVTNFGTRQSKGFGSFLCKYEDDENYWSWEEIKKFEYEGKTVLWAECKKNNIDDAMNNAAMVYAIMKGGINMSKNTKAWKFAKAYNKNKGSDIRNILKACNKQEADEIDKNDLSKFICTNEKKNDVNMAKGWKACLTIIEKFDGTFEQKIEAAIKNEICFYAPQKYIKGFLNTGAESGVRGDKAFIKGADYWKEKNKFIKRRKIEGEQSTEKKSKYEFLRILLGMADHYEFKDQDKMRVGTVYVRNYEGITVEDGEKKGNDKLSIGIERFKSPVTMKIYKEGFLFVFEEIPKELLGKWFYISDKKEIEKKRDLECKYFIPTPQKWSWCKFLKNFVEYYKSKEDSIKQLHSQYEGAAYIKYFNIIESKTKEIECQKN